MAVSVIVSSPFSRYTLHAFNIFLVFILYFLNTKMLKNPLYVYGEGVINVPSHINLGRFMLDSFNKFGGNIALINGSTHETLTYSEIAQEARNLAVSLTRMGVKKGDVVAISSENRREFWSTVIGIACTGAVVTTISIDYTNDELVHVMNISKPQYLFCSSLAFTNHFNTYKKLPFIRKIIMFGDEKLPNIVLYKDLAINTVNVKAEDFLPVEVEGQNDLLFILYSSGTTGLPKGVMLTHISVITLCSISIGVVELKGLTITPWCHAMGLISTLVSFARGWTNVYLPKFKVELYLKTVEKYKVEQIAVVPAALVALSKSNFPCDTSSVIVVYCGAAPLYEETAKAVKQRFPNAKVLQGYGMTEVQTITINSNPEKIGSVGTLVSLTAKIVNPETREVLGPNQEGEICIKGITLMKGYIDKDKNDDFDEEGFFKTGDIGYYDEDGYFYIIDRLKELIKYKGYQVPPAEIEAVLLQHPDIREAGVVGIPHLSAGEIPVAFVALQPNARKLTAADIQNHVAERLSNPKHIRGGVIFIDEIPKSPTGKILRRELRKNALMKMKPMASL